MALNAVPITRSSRRSAGPLPILLSLDRPPPALLGEEVLITSPPAQRSEVGGVGRQAGGGLAACCTQRRHNNTFAPQVTGPLPMLLTLTTDLFDQQKVVDVLSQKILSPFALQTLERMAIARAGVAIADVVQKPALRPLVGELGTNNSPAVQYCPAIHFSARTFFPNAGHNGSAAIEVRLRGV